MNIMTLMIQKLYYKGDNMGAIWKKSKENRVAIDLGREDIYGIDGTTFQCFYGNPDGTTTNVDNFEEFIKNIDSPESANSVGDQSAGTKDINVDDASGWEVGFVAKIDGKDEYYYVEKVDTDNNILTFRKGLKTDLADNTAINQVGNTGVYGTNVTIDTVGVHLFVISNPSIGLFNKSNKVEVVDYDENDVMDKLNEIEDKIDSLGAVDGVIIL